MHKYIIATIKDWNINQYNRSIYKKSKNWYLVTDTKKLTIAYVKSIKPKYIFFPHWSKRVNSKIINDYECVCFHETDVPYGRGGSPIQNLIIRNHKKTVITALKMTDEIDAGPIYLKKLLKLNGSAQQIYEKASKKVFKMINIIVKKNIMHVAQKGKVAKFKRRKPKQSILSKKTKSLSELYNHIRMLDAKTYPTAFIKYGNLRIEFKKAKINKKTIDASVSIKIN
jgi:methionyl-tRNA formyltransferase